jgi:hypothetical protein
MQPAVNALKSATLEASGKTPFLQLDDSVFGILAEGYPN